MVTRELLRIVSCFVLALLFGAATNAMDGAQKAASTSWQIACDGERVQVTLGLPATYEAPEPVELKNIHSATPLCVSVAHGNPYELLSWLENGSLRAAVLPAFAIEVLRFEDPARFERDYVVFDRSPVSLLQLRRRTVTLLDREGRPVSSMALTAWFAALRAAPAKEKQTIVLPHHLSLAVRELFLRASAWADAEKMPDGAREAFMRRVVESIHFQAVRGMPAPKALRFFEDTDAQEAAGDRTDIHDQPLVIAAGDRLIVRRQLLTNLTQPRVPKSAPQMLDARTVTTSPAPTSTLFATNPEDEARLGRAVIEFRDTSYRRLVDGPLSHRYFRFRLPELWNILEARDIQNAIDWPSAGGMALVLTGGGVKASYQTRLIDALYSRDPRTDAALTNEVERSVSTDKRPAQRVDYVIGTSGGALLGMFVGALKASTVPSGDRSLTSLLWRPGGQDLKSTQIFPALDMLRYLSIVVCFWVLWLAISLAVRWFGERWWAHVSSGASTHSALIESKERGRIVRWRSESWPWIALLFAAPLVVVEISNRKGLEHVPEIAGVFYVLMAAIAWYADISLSPLKPLRWRDLRIPKTFIAFALLGIACIVIPAFGTWDVAHCKPMPWQINLCFTGFLLLAIACYAFFAHQREFFRHERWHHGFLMFLGLLGFVGLCYLIVWIGVLLGKTSFLELTGGFWLWLLPAALVITIVGLVLGRVRRDQVATTRAQRMVGYVFGEHNSRAFWTGHRRLTRFVIIATLSWGWWNAIAAPGLYGNCTAQTYFENTYAAFTGPDKSAPHVTKPMQPVALSANCRDAGAPMDAREIELTVPYVVTATSLQRGQERYFLFLRSENRSAIVDRAWFNLASDGRWLTLHDYVGCDLRAAAFASGSPFPVFASHRVTLTSEDTDEQLIDGGFAHNKPLDAARVLGAGKVLVLNSSPLEETLGAGDCALNRWLKWGELACNVPKLFPYLWSRSQVEDSLSSAQMLVASIYPRGDGSPWPLLTDFRGATVTRMVNAAENDLDARIGTIESWGAPLLGNAYLLPLSSASLQRALAK